MAKPKRFVTAAATFSAALGIGFIMQYGDAVAARFAPEDAETGMSEAQAEAIASLAPAQASTIAIPEEPDLVTIVGDVEAVTIVPDEPAPTQLAAVVDIETPMFDVPQSLAQPDICDIMMTATPAALAMVDVTISAACHANSKLVVHHQGMMVSALTDDAGKLNLQIPALAEVAVFVAAFEDDQGAVAQAVVPDLALVDRAVLQWQGGDGVQLHALEFGAGYGESGHISAAATGDMTQLAQGTSGYLVSLGDPRVENALLAEVYTFPTGIAVRDGAIALNVEAEITAANCGREVSAQSLQIAPGRPTSAMDLTMVMPECDAIGEFLVLKNMFEDLTLASR